MSSTGVGSEEVQTASFRPGDDRQSSLVRTIADRLGSQREARWIVEHAMGLGSAGLFDSDRSDSDRSDSDLLEHACMTMADRRAAGEPLQYVLGHWPFRTLELVVDPRVLIPRPETERVVEIALQALRSPTSTAAVGMVERVARVCVDLGTGSGAIALSLAVEDDAAEVWATDLSTEALEVAALNLGDLSASRPEAAARVHLCPGAWYDALPPALAGRVDLIVSNPPYVAESHYPGLEPTVRDWEPRRALVSGRGVGGVEGMADIEAIISGAPRWLTPAGALVVEIDPAQAYASIDAARRAGFRQVATDRDLAGRLRMLVARR